MKNMSEQFCVTLRDDDAALVRQIAEAEITTPAAIIRTIVVKHLRKGKRKKKK